jgi:hypothetical protein
MSWTGPAFRIIAVVAMGLAQLPGPSLVTGSQGLAPESLRCPGNLPPGAAGWEVFPTDPFTAPLPGASGPVAVALDRACNLYVADSLNRQVVKLAPDRTVLARWAVPPMPNLGEAGSPRGIGVDAQGNVYVSHYSRDHVLKFAPDGRLVATWGECTPAAANRFCDPSQPGLFVGPQGVAVDGAGNVYVVEPTLNRVQKLTVDGRSLAVWQMRDRVPEPLMILGDPGLDAAGNLYVPDAFNHRILVLSPEGVLLRQYGGERGREPGRFALPAGVAVDAGGNLYVSEVDNWRVQKLAPDGTFLEQWVNCLDGPACQNPSAGTEPGQFFAARGLTVDGQGNLFVADTGNLRVQRLAAGTTPRPPERPPDALAPLAIEQTLRFTGGSAVPTVGEITEYEHVIQITNTDSRDGSGERWVASAKLAGARTAFSVVRQGQTLVLTTTTEYSPDTQVVRSTANEGQTSTRGSTLIWEGQIAPGQTLTLQTSLQQTPTVAGVVNEPIRAQQVTAATPQGRPLAVPPSRRPAPPPPQRFVQPAPPPVDPATGPRFFAETGFSIVDDHLWSYFHRRGGQRTFGAPISRLMLLGGAWVQLFERGMLQVFEDGRVVNVNLLEPPYLPYENLVELSLPPVDEALLQTAPGLEEPRFAERAQDFVREHAPEEFEGVGTRFYATFLGTVLFRDAFWDGRGEPNLVPGFNLEIWGLPTSRPTFEANGPGAEDRDAVLLRFQRGVMRHDAGTAITTAVPLGTYLRAVLSGDATPNALAEVAAASPLWAQYDREAPNGVARPEEFPETNLGLAFVREDE